LSAFFEARLDPPQARRGMRTDMARSQGGSGRLQRIAQLEHGRRPVPQRVGPSPAGGWGGPRGLPGAGSPACPLPGTERMKPSASSIDKASRSEARLMPMDSAVRAGWAAWAPGA
jgi:hypothetical protein